MKKNTRPQESICWNCKNARANLCAWIGRGEKIWDRGKKEKRSLPKSCQTKNKKYTFVYIVQDCKYFKPEGKRKTILAL